MSEYSKDGANVIQVVQDTSFRRRSADVSVFGKSQHRRKLAIEKRGSSSQWMVMAAVYVGAATKVYVQATGRR